MYLVIGRLHLARVIALYLPTKVQLHISILRNFSGIAYARAREDIIYEVFSAILVRASISVVAEWVQVLRLIFLQSQVFAQECHNAGIYRNVRALHAVV